MKRILKMLARLYPLSWRGRYGVEYEALLDDATPVREICSTCFKELFRCN
jgi:hypothetical protein